MSWGPGSATSEATAPKMRSCDSTSIGKTPHRAARRSIACARANAGMEAGMPSNGEGTWARSPFSWRLSSSQLLNTCSMPSTANPRNTWGWR